MRQKKRYFKQTKVDLTGVSNEELLEELMNRVTTMRPATCYFVDNHITCWDIHAAGSGPLIQTKERGK